MGGSGVPSSIAARSFSIACSTCERSETVSASQSLRFRLREKGQDAAPAWEGGGSRSRLTPSTIRRKTSRLPSSYCAGSKLGMNSGEGRVTVSTLIAVNPTRLKQPGQEADPPGLFPPKRLACRPICLPTAFPNRSVGSNFAVFCHPPKLIGRKGATLPLHHL